MRSRQFTTVMRRVAALALAVILAAAGFGSFLFEAASANVSAAQEGARIQAKAGSEIEKLIADLLKEPVAVRVESAADEKSPNAIRVTYGKKQALTEWLQDEAQRKALLDSLGYEDCKLFAQIDWAIDSPTAWHYSNRWDSDTGRMKVDTEHPDEYVLGEWAYIDCTVTTEDRDSMVIFTDLGDPKDENDVHWTNGKHGDYSTGWGSALKESQYSVVTVESLSNKNGVDNGTDNGNGADNGNTDNGNTDNGNGTDDKTDNNDNNDNKSDTTDDETGPYCAYIDPAEHTVYVRVRFGVKLTKKDTADAGDNGNGDNGSDSADGNTADSDDADGPNGTADNGNTDNGNTDNGNGDNGNGENGNGTVDADPKVVYVFSDWSNIAAYGVNSTEPMYRLGELFEKPEIKGVEFLDRDSFGGGPYIVYTLVASDDAVDAARSIELNGGFAQVILQARRAGSTEWCDLLDGEVEIQNGENKVDASPLGWGEDEAEDAKDIEVRALYDIYGSDGSLYESECSAELLCKASGGGAPVTPEPEATPTLAPTPTSSAALKELLSETVEKEKDDKCRLCGVCPVQPLGICLFVWVGGIIVILALGIFISRSSEDRKRKRARRRKQN